MVAPVPGKIDYLPLALAGAGAGESMVARPIPLAGKMA